MYELPVYELPVYELPEGLGDRSPAAHSASRRSSMRCVATVR